jgi:uncharacterized membrane protein YbaN (DUF454 family)
MRRILYLSAGYVSLGLGTIGAFLPLLPAVPLFILAAFCFTRSSPALEQWILTHPKYGSYVRLWRERGAIPRAGKHASLLAFSLTLFVSLMFVPFPWSLTPVLLLVIIGTWIWTRPEN